MNGEILYRKEGKLGIRGPLQLSFHVQREQRQAFIGRHDGCKEETFEPENGIMMSAETVLAATRFLAAVLTQFIKTLTLCRPTSCHSTNSMPKNRDHTFQHFQPIHE